MHAMSSRHLDHHFHSQQQHSSPTPPPSNIYHPYATSADLLSPSIAPPHVRSRSPSPYAPYLVTHQYGTRSHSPIVPTPVSPNMPRPHSPAPPPQSARGQARDIVPVPSPTPQPPEDVVMTSTINIARDIRDRPIINQYLIGHRLGKGQHGDVYKGYDMRRGNMVVAIKACRRTNPKEAKVEQLRQRNQGPIPRTAGGGPHGRPRLVDQVQNTEKKILREIAIMKKCKHGQIVQLYEVINDRLSKKILLIMEYMGGGEVKWRDDHGHPCLRVDQTRRICRDVVLGLLYLHHQGIIHRDIKPANLLWTADRKNVKITDFGVSHFSAAQRIDALKHSTAYREALERRKLERRKREEELSGASTPARRKTSVWRGSSNSKEDVKGKGRARDDPCSLKSGISSPTSGDEDAAAEKELLVELAGDVDPILLDDGGLSRQAGTPSFLAPEIIWEFGEKQTAALYSKVGLSKGMLNQEDEQADRTEASASLTTTLKKSRRLSHTSDVVTPRASDVAARNSLELPTPRSGETPSTSPDPEASSFHDPSATLTDGSMATGLPPRPSITKAIDVWALGVTLYCLLFGRTPWGGVTEFAMYQMIHTDDFQVDETMGYDRIPTGGRFHEAGDTSEGATVIGLLDRLLEKDCTKRVTLEEVKRLPWITRDIPNPEEWVAETAPERLDPIQITRADEDVAMTSVKFRWKFDVTKPLRRFRTLLPAGRRAATRQQQQAHRRAGQPDFYAEELDGILQRSLRAESESEKSERAITFATQAPASERPDLTRKSSRSRRMVDAVERGVRKISRQGSGVATPNIYGDETPRNMKRRTLPDLMIGNRGRSLSHSRETSRSRPSSRASGPATPRVASGGSCSNLTSPSTAGFTSDGETDILDSDDQCAIQTSQGKDRKKREKKHRQKASARQSLNISKILNWHPKGSPRASVSESSSKGSLSTVWSTRRPASPARGSRSGSTTRSRPTSVRMSFPTQRLSRRSADEFGASHTGLVGANGARAAASGGIGVRSDSGPTIASAGVAMAGRGLALASADELTSVMRASSWGDVADEFAYDYGYPASRRGEFDDADGASDYGFGNGSAYGDYMYDQGQSFAYESGDVDAYANNDDELRLVGAGGILSHPVSGPSSPNSLSRVSFGANAGVFPQDGLSLQGVAHEVGTATSGLPSPGAQVVVSSPGVSGYPVLQTTQLQDSGRRRGASVGSKHQHHLSQVVSSPLARSPLSVVDHDSPVSDELDLDQDVKINLSRDPSMEGSINVNVERAASPDSGERIIGRGMTGLKVEDEVREHDEVFADDDTSSSDDAPIEVRRRRPSELLARSRSRVRPERPEPPPSKVAGVAHDAKPR